MNQLFSTTSKKFTEECRSASFRTPHSALRVESRAGFTLIELLVVIGIIGLLAALVVGMAPIAEAKMRRARVETEREALVSAIESYKKAKGFYPPDNSATNVVGYTYQNTLFYELTGCIADAPSPIHFKSIITGENMTNTDIQLSFNVGGILNSSTVTNEIVNYFPGMKSAQHSLIKAPSGAVFSVIGVGVPGPVQLPPANGITLNPWNYVVSNPTHNDGGFDLWMDVAWAGKTNRVSNWTRDPVVQ
jgi:prepilin-type N-terminal cleavage/methylation domain-containing protein